MSNPHDAQAFNPPAPYHVMTRAEYIETGGFKAHCQYYGQFDTPAVRRAIPPTLITRCRESEDRHFNDTTSLSDWDHIAPRIRHEVARIARIVDDRGGVSLSDCVCALKESARRILADLPPSEL